MANSTLSFGAYCPDGGMWYACSTSTTQFVGCCASAGCGTDEGCPQEDLRPVSYNKTWHEQFQNQKCDNEGGSSNNPDRNASFYTCSVNNPPFLGCCTQNPCDLGECPQPNLVQMLLDGDDFLNGGPEFTPTGSPSASPSSDSDSGGMSTGAIVGISVGIVAVVLIIVGALIFFYRRRRQTAKAQDAPLQQNQVAPGAGQVVDQYHSPGMTKPGFSPDMNQYQGHGHGHGQGQDRYSTPAPAYYPSPGSPEQGHYAKMQDPGMSHGSPPSAMFQGTWDSINPAAPNNTGMNYMPGSQAAPAELDSGKETAELGNTQPGSPK